MENPFEFLRYLADYEEDDKPPASVKLAASLALALLDKAFSYLGGGVEKELLQNLCAVQESSADSLCQRDLFHRACISKFTGAVEELEHAIDDLEYLRLEEVVVGDPIPNFSMRGDTVFHKRLGTATHRLREAAKFIQFGLAHCLPSDISITGDRNRGTSCFLDVEEEAMVFGRDKEKEQIVEWLTQEPQAHHVSLLAVVGMAGMGKTTLARLVYADQRVAMKFDCRRWVSVPGKFSAHAITREIIPGCIAITGKSTSIPEKELVSSSKRRRGNTLADNIGDDMKLLLVLDDVWEDNNLEQWKSLVGRLNILSIGSCRILLTTRLQSVADMAAAAIGSTVECLKLDELDENDNLMLFRSQFPSHVFSQNYDYSVLVAEQISKSIGRCPLVTKMVSRQLTLDMETHHWDNVLLLLQKKDNLLQNLMRVKFMEVVVKELKLSYDRLPTELQICFRYCSIFPKGCKFEKVELASMWVGSGLVSSRPSNTMCLNTKKDTELFTAQDVGEQYFAALAGKSFFCSMIETDPSNGNLKEYYVLHSLMHDLAQYVSQGECAILQNDDFQHVRPTTRHLSIAHCSSLRKVSHLKYLRTLVIQSEFCLDQEVELALGEVLQNNKFLRLLYLDVPSLSHALVRISDLTHLRYLFLFSCDESHIHRVFQLYHLQVFKLSYFTSKEANFNGLCNLRSLRRLHVPVNVSSMIHQIGRLTTLEELHEFEIVENDVLSSLSNLTNLHRLSLRNIQNVRNCEEATKVNLKDKHHMRFLSLSWGKYLDNTENLDHQIIDSMEPNKEVQKLHIHGYNGVRLPIWIENSLLIHLVSLDLDYCMKWRTLPSFQDLISLKYLKLEHLFQLEYIGSVLEEQIVTNESENTCLPPALITLIVRWCPSLKKLPAIPCTLEKLIVKHVGLAVLPRIHMGNAGRSESSSRSVKSCLALLQIESCAHLTSLDEGLLEQQEYLQSLATLNVRHCERLLHVPAKGFTELQYLNFLEIVACPMLRDVKTEGSLLPMSLKNLSINPCGHIDVSFLMSLQNLTSMRRLTLFSCSNIEELPSEEVFSTLKNLTDMSIARCKNLLSFGGLGAAASLRVLSILCCDKLNSPCSPQTSATCSFKLYKLKVDRQALLLVEPLKSLTYTMELHIGDDYAMKSLPEDWLLQNAASLRSIEIGAADNLHSLPSQMEKLKLLQILRIERAPLIESLPRLHASLSKLTIWGCDPMFLKRCEKDVGQDWEKIAHISHVDIKAYSEGTSYYDDQIQYFDDSTSNSSRQFAVID